MTNPVANIVTTIMQLVNEGRLLVAAGIPWKVKRWLITAGDGLLWLVMINHDSF